MRLAAKDRDRWARLVELLQRGERRGDHSVGGGGRAAQEAGSELEHHLLLAGAFLNLPTHGRTASEADHL